MHWQSWWSRACAREVDGMEAGCSSRQPKAPNYSEYTLASSSRLVMKKKICFVEVCVFFSIEKKNLYINTRPILSNDCAVQYIKNNNDIRIKILNVLLGCVK